MDRLFGLYMYTLNISMVYVANPVSYKILQ